MHLSTADGLSLLCVKCATTRLGIKELDKAISLFYGYLSEGAVAIETMEDVALGHFFSGEIADEEARPNGKLIPLSLSHEFALLFQEGLVFPVDLGRPSNVFIVWRVTALHLLVLGTPRLTGAGARLGAWCLLAVWVEGSDIIVRVIIGMRCGLVLCGRTRRQAGYGGQRSR